MKVHRSAPVFFKASSANVDKAANVIRDVVIIQSGKDKYGDNFDTKFLEQLVSQGNAQGQGVKSRFGHPNMSDSALGSFLGRYKNFRVGTNGEIPVVLADLYLDDTAKASPKGNLYDYVVSMTEKNSDMFGNSIVYMPAEREEVITKDDTGNEKRIYYERLDSFLASDIVDSPAATSSLFKDYGQGQFAATVTNFLDEHPEVFELLQKDESVLNGFMKKYKAHKESKENKDMENSIITKIKSLLNIGKSKSTEEAANGMMINCDPDMSVGSMVTDDAGTPMLSQTIPMADGRTIKTDDGGVITEIVAAATAPITPPVAPDEKEINDLKLKLKSEQDTKSALQAKYDALETASKELIAEHDTVVKDCDQMKSIMKASKSKYEIPASNKTFAQSASEATSDTEVKLDKEARKAKLRNAEKLHA